MTGTGTALNVYPGGSDNTTVDLEPCQAIAITFNYSSAYSNGASPADLATQASACIYDSNDNPANPTCIFEWRWVNTSWQLYARGGASPVAGALASDSNTATTTFQITLNNGLASFYYNSQRRFIFSEIYRLPLRIKFVVPSTSYSPLGFTDIILDSRQP